jgi:hypothetical protein
VFAMVSFSVFVTCSPGFLAFFYFLKEVVGHYC